MRIKAILLVATLVFALSFLSGGESSFAQESTPIAGQTTSSQSGYVKQPLPGEILASANTLEMTMLTLAAGDSTGLYTHPGAAIYYVQAGSATIAVSATETAIVAAMTDDPTIEAPAVPCSEGCSVELAAGQWLSINSPAELQLDSVGGASLVIVSLTQESDEVLVTTLTESSVTITVDSNVP